MISPDKTFLGEKYGPMPVWGWMGIGLGAALAYSSWKHNKAASAVPQSTTPNAVGGQALPSNIVPQYTFVDESTTNIHIPPLGGRPPDQPAPTPAPPPPPPPAPTPTIDLGAWLAGLLPHSVPHPAPPPPPPAPAGHWDTVTKWPSPKGTLWGLATANYGNGTQWGRIWNAPQNTDLRNRRGVPEHIQPGDNFWIPA